MYDFLKKTNQIQAVSFYLTNGFYFLNDLSESSSKFISLKKLFVMKKTILIFVLFTRFVAFAQHPTNAPNELSDRNYNIPITTTTTPSTPTPHTPNSMEVKEQPQNLSPTPHSNPTPTPTYNNAPTENHHYTEHKTEISNTVWSSTAVGVTNSNYVNNETAQPKSYYIEKPTAMEALKKIIVLNDVNQVGLKYWSAERRATIRYKANAQLYSVKEMQELSIFLRDDAFKKIQPLLRNLYQELDDLAHNEVKYSYLAPIVPQIQKIQGLYKTFDEALIGLL